VLGTGGASKAVCHVLRQAGLRYFLVSRKKREGIIGYSDIGRDLIARVSLIINTTPLGMYPDTDTFPDLDIRCLHHVIRFSILSITPK
jgi:shikimate dehydrogenase